MKWDSITRDSDGKVIRRDAFFQDHVRTTVLREFPATNTITFGGYANGDEEIGRAKRMYGGWQVIINPSAVPFREKTKEWFKLKDDAISYLLHEGELPPPKKKEVLFGLGMDVWIAPDKVVEYYADTPMRSGDENRQGQLTEELRDVVRVWLNERGLLAWEQS